MTEDELLTFLDEVAHDYGAGQGCLLELSHNCVAENDCFLGGCALIREAINLLLEKEET